jgi:CRP/FNR family cyclic AMP-dependent transcriptional regulator
VSRRRGGGDEDSLLEVLRTSPIFSGGEEHALAELARQAVRLSYPAGAFLFRQGEPAAHVFVLTEGEVAVVSPARAGAEQMHSILGRGELLGELALLANGRRTAGARATSQTVAWAIGRDAFWAFLEATPSGSSALLRQVAERLASREALIDDLLSLDVKGRLAKALLGLAERHGRPGEQGGTVIALRLTHRDLAGMVGASRENVSRALATFRKRGLVDYDSSGIRLLDPHGLRRLT